jgi:hypothetical protein
MLSAASRPPSQKNAGTSHTLFRFGKRRTGHRKVGQPSRCLFPPTPSLPSRTVFLPQLWSLLTHGFARTVFSSHERKPSDPDFRSHNHKTGCPILRAFCARRVGSRLNAPRGSAFQAVLGEWSTFSQAPFFFSHNDNAGGRVTQTFDRTTIGVGAPFFARSLREGWAAD